MKNKYKVYDIYDGMESIGYADNIQEIRKLAKQRVEETDGECEIVYAPLNAESGKYMFSKYKYL